jgi:glycosyltransferase involved in cell wall biosynthesis
MKRRDNQTKTVHILYPNHWDVDSWSVKNELNLEPDKYQYGFNRLEKYGFKVTYCRFPKNYLIKKIGSLISRLMPFYFNLYYLIFQLKHFLNADIFVNPLDNEGFTLCWLRKYNFFGLRKKKHIFIAPWLSSYAKTCSEKKLKKYKALLSTVDLCLYYSENENKILQEYLNIPEEKLKKFHFGVDAEFYIPKEVQEENFILAPGNDSFRDFEILCDVFKYLPNETLYIASKNRIKNRVIPPNIQYLNLQYNRELLDYYRRAKMILIPIKNDCHTSSGTTVLMESMLLGKPIIATATNYIREIVDQKEIAILVEPNNANALIEAITNLNSNSVIGKKMVESARCEAVKYFTSEYCMQKLSEVIHLHFTQLPKPSVHVILPRHYRIEEWINKNAKGLVPGRMQYDMLRLNEFGLNVTYKESPFNPPYNCISQLSRFLLGFSIIHYIYQIRSAQKADCIYTPVDPEGIVISIIRKLKLFKLNTKPHIFTAFWLSHYLEKSKGLKLRLLKYFLRPVDLFLVSTPSIKRIIQSYLDIPASRFSYHAHGIDIDFFTPTDTSTDNFIFCVGNDSHRDFRILNEIQYKLTGTRLVFATELRDKDLGLRETSKLKIVHLKHKELLEYYNRARFIIITIKMNCVTDSGMTTLKEAMCMGKAVIVSATDVMKELVENGINGLLAEPGNVNEMVEKINYLLDNPEVCKAIGREAYKKRDYFSTKMQLNSLADDIKYLIVSDSKK